MNFTKGEWVIIALALVYALFQGAGNTPGFLIGSILGAGVLAIVIITGKRGWQSV